MLPQAEERSFGSEPVVFVSWYGGLPKNLKQLRMRKWAWLTQFKCNWEVSIDHTDNRAIREIFTPAR